MKPKNNNYGTIIGSTVAGASEIAFFHPLDTMAKRLMSHESKVIKSNFAETNKNLKNIVLQNNANRGWLRGMPTLYPGLRFATGYKISQRIYKYSGQHALKNYFHTNHKSKFDNVFGEKYSSTMISAISGSIIGVGEIGLLPLDVLKIKSQTNPESLKKRGVIQLFRQEGMGLYNGWQWTALRNAPGSFTLFGMSTFLKSSLFDLDINQKASLFQHFVCSTGASVACIAVSSPLDVIKTRIQNKNFGETTSGIKVIKDIIKYEGPTGFFRGVVPKMLVIGPKLTFSFTIAQYLIQLFSDLA